MSVALRHLEPRRRLGSAFVAAGLLLAVGAAVAAPSGTLLPGPTSAAAEALAALVLAATFAVGVRLPVVSFFGAIVLAVVDGAIRKWIYNDIVVYLLKDFLLLGVYAAVIPRLTRQKLARPWWFLAPLGLWLLLAVVYVARSPSLSQAAIGLRSYFIYVPLLWAAPAIVDRRSRAIRLLALLCWLGIGEALLGLVQSLAGPGVLNKLVSGAGIAIVTANGQPRIRPTGTFMQTGAFSFMFVLALVAALTLIVWAPTRRDRWLATAAIFAVAGSTTFTGARTLLVSGLLAIGACVLVALGRRDLRLAFVVPLVAALGIAVAVTGIPLLDRHVAPAVKSWFVVPPPRLTVHALDKLIPVVLRDDNNQKSTVRIQRRDLGAANGRSGRINLDAWKSDGTKVEIKISAAAVRQIAAGVAGASGVSSTSKPAASSGTAPASKPAAVSKPVVAPGFIMTPEAGTTGFLTRSVDVGTAASPASGSLWSTRVRPLFDLVTHPSFTGHGTGTMTLGAQYANPQATFLGESSYKKAAWELGLPGMVVFIWFAVAALVLCVLGAVRSSGWQRVCAATGVGVSTLLLLWMVLTFALDDPLVGQVFYAFTGLAAAAALRLSERSAPEPVAD